jgi:hypothetical protein
VCPYYYFSHHYQIALAVKIKPLFEIAVYLTHYAYYMTSNTTRVVQQNQISILISTKYFYIAELVQLPVLTAHYGELLYKTFFYGEFLNLYAYGERKWKSISTTTITLPNRR